MDYCGPRGIPHSRFLSWPQSDRDKAIWWSLRERARCPGCRTRAEEWDEAKRGHRFAYVATLVQCPGCVERQRAEEAPEMKQRGMHVVLTQNPHAD